ncbi:hypothetical protein [Spirillospora sp. CA-294931]|uniref:hypothetical protein n=1 Tax=Spirillospora sp. CA-294931 TaxID=3240042 RepID=UPI003D8E3218
MKRRYAVAATSTAVGATLLLSACGGSSETSTENMKLSAGQALLKSSQKTADADRFKASLTVSDSKEGAKIRASGQFSLQPKLTFSAKLDEFSKGGQAVPGEKGQAVFTGDTLYAKLPQLAQFVSGGKPWVKVDVAKAGQMGGFDVKTMIEQVQKINPAEQTKMFTGSKDVRRVGEESVDGVKTTHYTGTVTVQDALGRLDGTAREKVRQWFPQDASKEKISFDLWTDKNQLPRKLVSKGSGNGESGTVTVIYSDYGKKFGVNAPPSDQVGELSLNGLLGGGTHKPGN